MKIVQSENINHLEKQFILKLQYEIEHSVNP